jgi:hypothetical protein
MNERGAVVAEFSGEAHCEQRGRQLHISGAERGSTLPLRVVFGGCEVNSIPERLQELRIVGAMPEWQLSAGQLRYAVNARAVQVLRDMSTLTIKALPGAAPSWRGRLGWALLLNLLRIPGAASALKFLRGG